MTDYQRHRGRKREKRWRQTVITSGPVFWESVLNVITFLCLAVTSLCHVIQAKGMLEVKRLAVELRVWFASTRSTFYLSLSLSLLDKVFWILPLVTVVWLNLCQVLLLCHSLTCNSFLDGSSASICSQINMRMTDRKRALNVGRISRERRWILLPLTLLILCVLILILCGKSRRFLGLNIGA